MARIATDMPIAIATVMPIAITTDMLIANAMPIATSVSQRLQCRRDFSVHCWPSLIGPPDFLRVLSFLHLEYFRLTTLHLSPTKKIPTSLRLLAAGKLWE